MSCDWLITEAGHSPALKSVFALGNGYLGLRGTDADVVVGDLGSLGLPM